MNYFCHAVPFLDDPFFVSGTAVPDWLSVLDRKCRARSANAEKLVDDTDPRVAAVARGIVQHHHDDGWFHQTRAFMELNLEFTLGVRDRLPPDNGFRPSFVGHLLVELLLDAELIAAAPERLDTYYEIMDGIDGGLVQEVVNRVATRPTTVLARFIPLFSRERFLYDYIEDEKLLKRLNNVMHRVGLPALPASLASYFGEARAAVARRQSELLAGRGEPSGDKKCDLE